MPIIKNAPLLSIVIPTRNRQVYALQSVISILRIPDAELEVVVQDNSDTKELEALLRDCCTDHRLRYNYVPEPLSFVANFDLAVALATGEYICVIGDDDGVNPEIMEGAQWAKDNAVDTLKPSGSVQYLWPGSGIASTRFSDVPQETGRMTIHPFSGRITSTDNEQEMLAVVRRGGQEYLKTELPKLYHGIVRRECLERVREQTGAYFGGLSPDIYAAMAIAAIAKMSVSIDYPLTIPGACRQSGSVESQVGKHIGPLEVAPHLNNRGAYDWAKQVPAYYSVQTIWADSAVAAIVDMGRKDILADFNVAYLSACCLWAHPKYGRIILRDLYRSFGLSGKSWIVGTFQLIFSFLKGPGRLFFKRIMNRLRIIFRGENSTRLDGVNDIIEATDALSRYLVTNGYSFSQLGDKKRIMTDNNIGRS